MTRADEERAGRERLRLLAPALPGSDWERATWFVSDSNDAWRRDDVVLRVCWRGDRARLLREARIARALPESMRYPPVLDAGESAGCTWMLTRFVPGTRLADTWLDMQPDRLRAIVAELAAMLKVLHAWSPPAPIAAALAEREARHAPGEVVNLLPLPAERAGELIGPVSSLRGVDPELMRAVDRRLTALTAVDPFAGNAARAVVHGDAQGTNLIIDGHGIAALVDYEWCRMAPIDAELAIWLHVLRVGQIKHPGRVVPPVLEWLREDYRALFAAPDLEGRLWLYALTFALQGMLIWPPDAEERDLVATHHLHALRALVDAPPPPARALA